MGHRAGLRHETGRTDRLNGGKQRQVASGSHIEQAIGDRHPVPAKPDHR